MDLPILVLAVSFLVLMLLNVPVAFSMGIAAMQVDDGVMSKPMYGDFIKSV